MIPMKFEEANRCLTKPADMTDEECGSLWVYSDGHDCVSCWKLTFRERISVLLFGRVWLGILTGYTQPPVWLDARRTVFEKDGDQ